MSFFQEIKDDLETLAEDLTTIEHALLQKNEEGDTEVIAYRKQEMDGDSIIYINSKKEIDQETLEDFNQLFRAGIISRQGILQSIIKIFK